MTNFEIWHVNEVHWLIFLKSLQKVIYYVGDVEISKMRVYACKCETAPHLHRGAKPVL